MQSAKNSAFSGSAGASVFKPINDTEKLLDEKEKEDVVGLPPSVDNNEDAQAKTKQSAYNTTLLLKILLILVVIVIIVALIIFYFYRNAKNEGNKVKMEVEAYKKTDEILKNRVQTLDNQLKQMQSDNEYQRKQITRLTAERAREQQNRLPQNTYSEFPTDAENNQNSISLYSNTDNVTPVSNVKSKNKKDEIKMMVNKPRKTVEEMQQEQSAEMERRRQQQDDVIRNELESNTKVKIIDDGQDEGEEKDAIFSAISNSGKLDE